MPRTPEPYVITWRTDTKTFQFTLNFAYGLNERVCDEWRRRSFHSLPDELANLRYPKKKSDAKAAVDVLIAYLRKKQEEEGSARRVTTDDITVNEWVKKFTAIETSPRTGINASKNRPYSLDTL